MHLLLHHGQRQAPAWRSCAGFVEWNGCCVVFHSIIKRRLRGFGGNGCNSGQNAVEEQVDQCQNKPSFFGE